jgi:large subunit ribosomal protein L17
MRHRKHTSQLSRTAAPRKAMVRSLVEALLQHEKIRTTVTRAAVVRSQAEKMITLAKDGSLAARRAAFAFLQHKEIVHRLFEELGPRFAERPGGYMRIIRDRQRMGDGAEMAIIEMVDRKIEVVDENDKDKKKSRSQRIREMRRAMARNMPRG